MEIDWKINSHIPFHTEEPLMGILCDHLFVSCGYSKRIRKQNKGFSPRAAVFNLKTKKWKSIKKFPGGGRQGGRAVTINNELYCWGGWCYIPITDSILKQYGDNWPKKIGIKTFSDGYKLSYDIKNDTWKWTKLVNLPYEITNFSLCSDGKKAYLACGSRCLEKYGQLSTDVEDIGRRVFSLDIKSGDKWKELEPLPGTTRINCASFFKDNYLYILGGVYTNYEWQYGSDKCYRFLSADGNWKYDIKNKKWERLAENPYVISSWSSSGNIIYDNKAILFGSPLMMYKYKDGEIVKNENIERLTGKHYRGCRFTTCNIILLYDIETDSFTKSTSKLPLKVNLPAYQVNEKTGTLHLLGGEISGHSKKVDGVNLAGKHLNMNLQGKIVKM